MCVPNIPATISKSGKNLLKPAVLNNMDDTAQQAHLQDNRVAICAIQLPGARRNRPCALLHWDRLLHPAIAYTPRHQNS